MLIAKSSITEKLDAKREVDLLIAQAKDQISSLPELEDRKRIIDEIHYAIQAVLQEEEFLFIDVFQEPMLTRNPTAPAHQDTMMRFRSPEGLLRRFNQNLLQVPDQTAVDIYREIHQAIREVLRGVFPEPEIEAGADLQIEQLQTPLVDLDFSHLPQNQPPRLKNALSWQVYKYAGNILYVDFEKKLQLSPLTAMLRGIGEKTVPIIREALLKIPLPLGKKLSPKEIKILRDFAVASTCELAAEKPQPPEKIPEIIEAAPVIRRPQQKITADFLNHNSSWMGTNLPLSELLFNQDYPSADRKKRLGNIFDELGYHRMGDLFQLEKKDKVTSLRLSDELRAALAIRLSEDAAKSLITFIQGKLNENSSCCDKALSRAEVRIFQAYQQGRKTGVE